MSASTLKRTQLHARSLAYHDVVPRGESDFSGFPGPSPARYKITEQAFEAHLQSMARMNGDKPALVDGLAGPFEGSRSFLLTFDDGGVSAYTYIAPMLERLGWRGHFLVTVGRMGTPGFLTGEQVRDLRTRGHVIGTHSYSHPDPMSALSPEQMLKEWQTSVQVLADLLGEPIRVASVPGGFFTHGVAHAAATAGIRVLFTSAPTSGVQQAGECLVLGRYIILGSMSPGTVAALAAGRVWPCLKQWLSWTVRQMVKMTLSEGLYIKMRRFLLDYVFARR